MSNSSPVISFQTTEMKYANIFWMMRFEKAQDDKEGNGFSAGILN